MKKFILSQIIFFLFLAIHVSLCQADENKYGLYGFYLNEDIYEALNNAKENGFSSELFISETLYKRLLEITPNLEQSEQYHHFDFQWTRPFHNISNAALNDKKYKLVDIYNDIFGKNGREGNINIQNQLKYFTSWISWKNNQNLEIVSTLLSDVNSGYTNIICLTINFSSLNDEDKEKASNIINERFGEPTAFSGDKNSDDEYSEIRQFGDTIISTYFKVIQDPNSYDDPPLKKALIEDITFYNVKDINDVCDYYIQLATNTKINNKKSSLDGM